MPKIPTAPVSETIAKVMALHPPDERGFIIALPAGHTNPLGRVRWFISIDKMNNMVDSASYKQVEEARLFPTYSEASEVALQAAASWGTAYGQLRIVEVTRRPPLTIHSDLPISVLDALAEI